MRRSWSGPRRPRCPGRRAAPGQAGSELQLGEVAAKLLVEASLGGRGRCRGCHRGGGSRGHGSLDAYRFRRHLYYATSAIRLSIPSSNSDGDRYPSAFCIRLRFAGSMGRRNIAG